MTAHSTVTIDVSFAEHLARLRTDLETRLDALLPAASGERDLVASAMREGALAPGKRMRPLLLMLAADGLGACEQAALDLACAVEMVHAASLVLDDMPCMDNAQLRRGRATVHLAFGEDVAILAAIALLSRAFALVAEIETVPAPVRNQLVTLLANAIGSQGLVKGQFQDLRDGTQPRTAEEIAATNALKTGVLFSAIMDMACLIGDAGLPVRGALQGFALELGQAFQLYDDLRDRDTDTGKDQGKDDGKSTFVALCGEAKVRERLQGHLARAQSQLAQAFDCDMPIGRFLQLIFARAGNC
ncbi:Geranylgeranyl diphosphate synthase [Pseudomonas fluorescens]|uniref:polyprenyl synthetase family protein n=1 Tax=Pseudomonas fluorescens TaxID=294 RepID=UPI001252E994|nr:polyprenyl synthetase family protein [Pseudomonas fluorescens]CAG8863330.1 Geranylgeranyl diphosphate synthase [Pseudomonas fluorescens]VVQ01474.1 Geranylgeranyl diphosphate synthase [Pseudomonas fluorescens]